jgi:hypothetical protein
MVATKVVWLAFDLVDSLVGNLDLMKVVLKEKNWEE